MPSIRLKQTDHDKAWKYEGDAQDEIDDFEEHLRKMGIDPVSGTKTKVSNG
jgi:hypothetical protein